MDIRSMNLEEMEALAISLGEKAFRGKQLFQWVHEKQADDFDEMTNLSAAFREKLKENYCISGVRQVEKQVSKKEDTAKYLFALEDDHVIESVGMPDGMYILCVYTYRTHEESDCRGNALTDLSNSERYKRESIEYHCDGNGRAP